MGLGSLVVFTVTDGRSQTPLYGFPMTVNLRCRLTNGLIQAESG
jgi:hypothetical protein